ncbi:hypothetical protein GCM10010256_50120 [Streptomyces coeruleorubidus]|nr:hypothetical protein GCM10010256_50120 [Streptomyces coeruleorubidus]
MRSGWKVLIGSSFFPLSEGVWNRLATRRVAGVENGDGWEAGATPTMGRPARSCVRLSGTGLGSETSVSAVAHFSMGVRSAADKVADVVSRPGCRLPDRDEIAGVADLRATAGHAGVRPSSRSGKRAHLATAASVPLGQIFVFSRTQAPIWAMAASVSGIRPAP